MRISAAECDGLVTRPACRTGRRPPLTTPRTSTRTRTITTTRRTNTFAPTFAVRPSAFTSLVTSSREIIKAATFSTRPRPIQFRGSPPDSRIVTAPLYVCSFVSHLSVVHWFSESFLLFPLFIDRNVYCSREIDRRSLPSGGSLLDLNETRKNDEFEEVYMYLADRGLLLNQRGASCRILDGLVEFSHANSCNEFLGPS